MKRSIPILLPELNFKKLNGMDNPEDMRRFTNRYCLTGSFGCTQGVILERYGVSLTNKSLIGFSTGATSSLSMQSTKLIFKLSLISLTGVGEQ